ncbi:hypothetical protein H6P81_007406 [Aristolochia fimbriata]|uniref:NAD-dependent epimerase/dehydratase domain-containing protein n=1 Tax=Aristolochia fimbriata TaxID=158543 RepID=A0AAV7F3Y1_ARIFI|nr:hypothetical protein H6P81_007406 [Aristolochia fimbriata]
MDSTEVEEDSTQPLLGRSSSGVSAKLNAYLYTGHFLARWGARMWEFAVGLYMISIWPNSLLFTAIYGVVESASVALFGPFIGRCIDRYSYIQVLRAWLLMQNLSFVVAGISVFLLLFYQSLKFTNFSAFIFLVILTNLTGAIAVLSSMAGIIMIERDWVVVISSGKSENVLTEMNSTIRRIDLICKLMAPVFTGFIISFISLKASTITLSLWNALSVSLQYWLLLSVYNGYQALSENSKRTSELVSDDTSETSLISKDKNDSLSSEAVPSSSENGYVRKGINFISKLICIDEWIVYLKQDVVLPGVALALLYFTVLSFGTLMTATLQWKGIPAYVIGIARGVSAVIGISATFLYPVLHSRISTLRTGLWSIWTQWCFLVVCVASIWVQSGHVSAWILMAGVAASRLGLWMFDLSVMQLMQDLVPESDRCVVGGVQSSLQSMLDLMNYIMGIIISNPQEFSKLVIISFSSVTLAAILLKSTRNKRCLPPHELKVCQDLILRWRQRAAAAAAAAALFVSLVMAPEAASSPHQISKSVCVMDASSLLGASLVEKLLNRGYTVHAAVQDQGTNLNVFKGLPNESRKLKVFQSDPFDYQSIMDAIKGCSGLFYTFQPPQEQTVYDEFMAEIEVRAAHNVLEACAQTETIEKVVFTSSITAVVWKENRKSGLELDERDWSDPSICRKFKLWHALAKTMAEKTAWALAMDRGINMVSVNAGLLLGPRSSLSDPYLKGAAEMYEDGVLVTVEGRALVDAHLSVFEGPATFGRYLCFNRVINRPDDALKLAQMLSPETPCASADHDLGIFTQRISNKKLNKLMVQYQTGFQKLEQ